MCLSKSQDDDSMAICFSKSHRGPGIMLMIAWWFVFRIHTMLIACRCVLKRTCSPHYQSRSVASFLRFRHTPWHIVMHRNLERPSTSRRLPSTRQGSMPSTRPVYTPFNTTRLQHDELLTNNGRWHDAPAWQGMISCGLSSRTCVRVVLKGLRASRVKGRASHDMHLELTAWIRICSKICISSFVHPSKIFVWEG